MAMASLVDLVFSKPAFVGEAGQSDDGGDENLERDDEPKLRWILGPLDPVASGKDSSHSNLKSDPTDGKGQKENPNHRLTLSAQTPVTNRNDSGTGAMDDAPVNPLLIFA